MLFFSYEFIVDSTVVREYILYDFNFLKFVEFFMIQDIVYLDIFLWALENNVYSAGGGRALVDGVAFYYTSLLIFCSVVLATVERRVLKSPTVIMHLSITLLSSITLFSSIFCLMHFAALFWCTHI